MNINLLFLYFVSDYVLFPKRSIELPFELHKPFSEDDAISHFSVNWRSHIFRTNYAIWLCDISF